jgi:APA family basic amino acid/polyamine antiporter
MVSCLSEEVKNPERNLPIGIIGSLFVSMTIYTTVSLAVVGMAPISILGENTPIVNALLGNGCCTNDQMQQLQHEIDHSDNVRVQQCLSYSCEPIVQRVLFVGSRIVSAGAMFGLTTATFSCLMGQPRIFYSMAVDGLLFKVYAKVSPRTGVPTIGTVSDN